MWKIFYPNKEKWWVDYDGLVVENEIEKQMKKDDDLFGFIKHDNCREAKQNWFFNIIQ